MWCEFWITRVKRKSKRIRNTRDKKTNVKTYKKKTTEDKRYSSNVKISGGYTLFKNGNVTLSRKFPSFSIALCDFKISLNFKNETWHLQYMKVRIFNRSYSVCLAESLAVSGQIWAVSIFGLGRTYSMYVLQPFTDAPHQYLQYVLLMRVSNYRLFKHRLFTECLRLSLGWFCFVKGTVSGDGLGFCWHK